MTHNPGRSRVRSGLTLIELLCVMVIITILASLLLGPASRALGKARAMKWAADSEVFLQAAVEQLQKTFRGKGSFPLVTLASIETNRLVDSSVLTFLKDRRVTFFPFAGSDPDEKIVILVRLDPGFLVESNSYHETKGRITAPPQ